MRKLLVCTLATALAFLAGGQLAMAKEGHEDPREGATGVISPVPDDLEPGQPWTATITYLKDGGILQAEGFSPIITLRNLGTGEVTTVTPFFHRPGVFTARIVFPEAGHWSVRLHDSFTGRVTDATTFRLSPAPAQTSDAPSIPAWSWAMSALLSLLLVAAAYRLLPRLRRKPAIG